MKTKFIQTRELISEIKKEFESNKLQTLMKFCSFVGQRLLKKEDGEALPEIVTPVIGLLLEAVTAYFAYPNDDTAKKFISDLDEIENLVIVYEIADKVDADNEDEDDEDDAHAISDAAFSMMYIDRYDTMDIPFAEKVMSISREIGAISDKLKPNIDIVNIINATMAAKELGDTKIYDAGMEVLKKIADYDNKIKDFQKFAAYKMQVNPIHIDENGNAEQGFDVNAVFEADPDGKFSKIECENSILGLCYILHNLCIKINKKENVSANDVLDALVDFGNLPPALRPRTSVGYAVINYLNRNEINTVNDALEKYDIVAKAIINNTNGNVDNDVINRMKKHLLEGIDVQED